MVRRWTEELHWASNRNWTVTFGIIYHTEMKSGQDGGTGFEGWWIGPVAWNQATLTTLGRLGSQEVNETTSNIQSIASSICILLHSCVYHVSSEDSETMSNTIVVRPVFHSHTSEFPLCYLNDRIENDAPASGCILQRLLSSLPGTDIAHIFGEIGTVTFAQLRVINELVLPKRAGFNDLIYTLFASYCHMNRPQ
jgi:hypothetical protein